jgi:hypothetical protein
MLPFAFHAHSTKSLAVSTKNISTTPKVLTAFSALSRRDATVLRIKRYECLAV